MVRLEAYHSRVVGNPMEPRAGLAAYDGDTYYLYACTQGATAMRGQLAAVLGVPPEKIRVVAEENTPERRVSAGGVGGMRGNSAA